MTLFSSIEAMGLPTQSCIIQFTQNTRLNQIFNVKEKEFEIFLN